MEKTSNKLMLLAKKNYVTVLSFLLVANCGDQAINPSGQPKFVLENVRVITDGTRFFIDPEWSPDGKKIAFTERGWIGLWVYFLEDNTVKQLSDEPSAGFKFSWLKDSDKIAFKPRIRQYFDGQLGSESTLKIVDVYSHEIIYLYTSRLLSPPIVLDENIIWVRDYQNKTNKIFDKNGIEIETFPDKKIVYTNLNSRIVVSNPDGTNEEMLSGVLVENTHLGIPEYERFVEIDISSDGNRVLAANVSGSIKIFDLMTKRVTEIGVGLFPQWSQSDQHILYHLSIENSDGHVIQNSDLFVKEMLSNSVIQLTHTESDVEMRPRWSPDGKMILFYSYKSGRISIGQINIQ